MKSKRATSRYDRLSVMTYKTPVKCPHCGSPKNRILWGWHGVYYDFVCENDHDWSYDAATRGPATGPPPKEGSIHRLDRKLLKELIKAKWDGTEAFAKAVEGLTLKRIQYMLTLDCYYPWEYIEALATALNVDPETLRISRHAE